MVASVEVPFVRGMDYGVGFDTATGSACNKAATGTPSTPAGDGGDIISFSMEQVETVEDLLTSLGVSAKASGGIGLFSASARFDFAQKCKVHSSSVFLVVSVKITEAFKSIAQPGIEAEAAALLAANNTDRFREEFGDMFVRGIQSGGQFFGVIEVQTRDQTDSKTISAGLSASYAAFSASGSFDKTFTDTVNSHRTKVTCYIEGGQDRDLPTAIDTMTKRAVEFPGECAGHAVSYLALLDGYGVLPLPKGPNFADLQQQKDVLVECARLRNLHQQWLNDIDYISGHLNEFVNPDPTQLNQLHNDISADLNDIAAAASTALNDPKAAKNPTGMRINAVKLPDRLKTAAVTAPSPPQVEVPDFRKGAAFQPNIMSILCNRRGLHAQFTGPLEIAGPNGTKQTGEIVSTNPSGGSMVATGSVVTCDIGNYQVVPRKLVRIPKNVP